MRKLMSLIIALSLVSFANGTPVQAASGNTAKPDQALIEFVRAPVTIDSEGMFIIDSKVTGRVVRCCEASSTP